MFKKAVLFSKIRNVVLCLITVIFCTAVFPPTHAATQTGTVTWTGYGGNYLWSTPDNWSTKKVPVTYQGIVVIPEELPFKWTSTPPRFSCSAKGI